MDFMATLKNFNKLANGNFEMAHLVVYTKRTSGKAFARIFSCPKPLCVEFKREFQYGVPYRKDSGATQFQIEHFDFYDDAEEFINNL